MSHAVPPSAARKEPAAHLAHRSVPLVAAMVPGAQSVGAVAPVAHDEPGGQLVQSSCDVAPAVARKLPASHAVGALTPASQYEPAGQSLHAVAPPADWYLPATHESQLLWPLVAVKEAGLHNVDAVARSRQ